MKTWNVALLTAFGASVAVLGGCSSDDSPADDGVETVRSALQRDMHPTLSGVELDTLATGQADFAVDIFRAVAKGKGSDNVFLSPHSISIALGMTYAGARGETAMEMKKALHFDLPDDRAHAGLNYLDLELASRGQGALAKDGKPFRLNVTNSIWGQNRASFEASFLDVLAVNYGAGINIVDFQTQAEESRKTINGWVAKKTENRIEDLLPVGVLDSNTKAVLVNAVYFNAAWKNRFTESGTTPAPFTKLDSSTVDVPTMHLFAKSFPYASTDDYEAIALPYDGDELSMLVVVPKAGEYATFETALTGGKVLDILAGLETTSVNLAFPKLKVEADFRLSAPLEELGMKKAFKLGEADFSGITTRTQLAITDVFHKTLLTVDENGTEAAAATAVVAGNLSAGPVDVVKMSVDRPFLTAIVDNKTKTLVFLGRILEPKN